MPDAIASLLDALHALLMVLWITGIPLLFWHRWPRLSRAYAAYSIAFIVVSQGSQWLLGECFLTTWARYFWLRGSGAPPNELHRDWFTVRCAEAVFHMRPSQRAVSIAWETLVLVSSVGMLVWLAGRRGQRR